MSDEAPDCPKGVKEGGEMARRDEGVSGGGVRMKLAAEGGGGRPWKTCVASASGIGTGMGVSSRG